jgi:hypothetical protein
MIETRLGLRLGLGAAHQYGYVPRPIALLPARRERPYRSRAAEKSDELATPDPSCHLIPPAGRATGG